MKLENKVAIVTASTKGIGLAISLKLASEGAKVYLAARNEQLVKEIKEANSNLNLNYVHFDATDKKTYTSMIDEVFEKEKRVDILVNNFGTSNPVNDKTIYETDADYFMQIMDENLMSVFIPTQRVLKYMREQKSGAIVNISSIGSIIPDVARIAYVTSKAAINALTKNIALQVGGDNIRCNAILPGLIQTPAVERTMPKQFVDMFKKCTTLDRVGNVDDIAKAALFLASDDSSYINGEILEVAGGFGKTSPLFGMLKK